MPAVRILQRHPEIERLADDHRADARHVAVPLSIVTVIVWSR
jgi:hypothetical protein